MPRLRPGLFIVCRTAEVVWHTFFIANLKMFLTFALATQIKTYCSIPFCWKVYFPRNIDDCPVYGVSLSWKLDRQFRQMYVSFV